MAGGRTTVHGEGLGRALVWQRNKATVATKERGHARQPLESIIEVSHIDAVLQRAAKEDLLLGGGDGADDDVLSAALWFQAHRYDLAIEGRLVAGALMAEADGADGRQPWVPQRRLQHACVIRSSCGPNGSINGGAVLGLR
uniref:Uncharacterized protein n=1 Tax=Oryza meridionalis TaxID=40149 RepID=A0A0E0DPH3_9ORYZ